MKTEKDIRKMTGVEKEREDCIPAGQSTQKYTSHTLSLRRYDHQREKTGADHLMFFAGGGESHSTACTCTLTDSTYQGI